MWKLTEMFGSILFDKSHVVYYILSASVKIAQSTAAVRSWWDLLIVALICVQMVNSSLCTFLHSFLSKLPVIPWVSSCCLTT